MHFVHLFVFVRRRILGSSAISVARARMCAASHVNIRDVCASVRVWVHECVRVCVQHAPLSTLDWQWAAHLCAIFANAPFHMFV